MMQIRAPKASRQLLHKGKKFNFEILEFPGADGQSVRREVVRHPGAVVILPLLDDGQVVLIQNHRPALDRVLYELPAGTIEPGEDPATCARRELTEETGFQTATLSIIGRFYTSPGMSDELMWAFIAVGLTHVGPRPENDERITVAPRPVPVVTEMIDSGELMDGKSMLTLLMAQRRGLI